MTNPGRLALLRPPSLRERLVELRADLIDRMARRDAIEPGLLSVIGGIAATLQVIDQSADGAASVAVDDSGEAIRLIVHHDGGAVAAVEIAPTRAIRIAGELLDSAGLRLGAELAAARRKAAR